MKKHLTIRMVLFITALLILVGTESYLNVEIQLIIGKVIDALKKPEIFKYYLIVFMLISIVEIIAYLLMTLMQSITKIKIDSYVKKSVMKSMIRIRYQQMRKYDETEIRQMWLNDSADISSSTVTLLFQFIVEFVTGVIAVIQLFKISMMITLVVVSVMIGTSLLVHLVSTYSEKVTKSFRKVEAEIKRDFYNLFGFFRLQKIFENEKSLMQVLSDDGIRYVQSKTKFLMVSQFFRTFSRVLAAVSPVLVIVIGGGNGTNKLSVGQVAACITLVVTINAPIQDFNNLRVEWSTFKFKIDKLRNFNGLPKENYVDGKELQHISEIEFNNVGYTDGATKILESIDFRIKSGEKVAIVGASGSGKTTLVKVLSRLVAPTDGHVYINRVDISSYELQSLRNKIGFMTSTPFIENRTIDTLLVNHQEGQSLINRFRLQDNTLFHDLSETVSESTISGGQKKLYGLLDLLQTEHEILVFDELTTGLDWKTAQGVISELLKSSVGVIVITHENVLLEKFDKIIVMDNGRISQVGTPDEVIQKNSFFRKLVCGNES
ncbi:ATP-binding cassette domain-containing protein [Lactiplantibacillus pentosus]|uniref:ATP-binding cassette domain-containing protein n=1 Tax=Lactiplantibacillus pentosus TaxID=1589 RepID=UPI0021A5A846|nr:ABC transporter ATP-binding protein [Lactiplantibacillus pentosus]MCT3286931.1 ABC transporter ATP-binding protein [Lactiplantibacillus pentosus]